MLLSQLPDWAAVPRCCLADLFRIFSFSKTCLLTEVNLGVDRNVLLLVLPR